MMILYIRQTKEVHVENQVQKMVEDVLWHRAWKMQTIRPKGNIKRDDGTYTATKDEENA